MAMPHEIQPADVQTWFPDALQQRYTNHLIGQSGLTPTQARHFVRLWGYGYLLQHGSDYAPITTLTRKISRFFCSQSEAAKLFYGANQGTARSAGLMINKFVEKQLVRRERFSGSKTRISLYISESFELPDNNQPDDVYADAFKPRQDIPRIALLLEGLFSFDDKRPDSMLNNLRNGLRQWAQQYSPGLRILRLSQTKAPVAFAAIFPIHQESELFFDLPPSQSLYLSRLHLNGDDPIKFAPPGDLHCRIAYIRSWQIHPDFWSYHNALCMVKDTQVTMRRIYQDYPELSDVYSIGIHPKLEEFARTLGFEVMKRDPDTSLCWLYMSLDSFLALDPDEALLEFDYLHYT